MAATAPPAAPDISVRDAILDAAERRFADRGFDGVPVREIAADVGLKNQASLYHYYASKQAIYEAALQRGIASILARVTAHDSTAGAPYVDPVFDYLVEHPHLARLIQRAGLDDSPFVRAALPGLIRPLYEQGVRALAATGGPWSADELPHLAAGLYHLVFGYFADAALLRSVLPDDPASAASIARQRRFLSTAIALLLGTEER